MIKGWTIGGLALVLVALFLMERVQAFTIISNAGQPANWPGGVVHYDFYKIPAGFMQPIHKSFDVWTEVPGVSLSVNFQGVSQQAPRTRDGRNTVSWVESGWASLGFNPPANALAVTLSSFNASTGQILDSDIYFNAQNFSWGDGEQNPHVVDVWNIGSHEVGHLLGLDHSSVSFFESDPKLEEATMFFASSYGETFRRIPAEDDELGIRNLYPDLSDNEYALPAARIDSVELISSSGNILNLRVFGANFTEQTSFVLTAKSSGTFDVVSRYRSIISPNEAEVQLNKGSFSSNFPFLLAFNDSASIDSFSLFSDSSQADIVELLQGAGGSGGSGGGCQLRLSSTQTAGSWAVLLGFLFLVFLARRMAKSLQVL
ncbi:MAG: hypothetical protein EA369_06585 [Bradymonadales bacterium]|nr:MAG: hypothetical protein EA369_06585 [Bradymonadales bacterium]